MGMKAIEMKASVLLAQPTPRSMYIAEAKRGKPVFDNLRQHSFEIREVSDCPKNSPAPKADLIKSFPASTEAAYSG